LVAAVGSFVEGVPTRPTELDDNPIREEIQGEQDATGRYYGNRNTK